MGPTPQWSPTNCCIQLDNKVKPVAWDFRSSWIDKMSEPKPVCENCLEAYQIAHRKDTSSEE